MDDLDIGKTGQLQGGGDAHAFSLAAGNLLGEYRILRPLGAGGMGEVYLARHEMMDRQVALKVLTTGFLADAEFVERFQREVRVLARLKHPHIVPVQYAGMDRDRYFLAMDPVIPEESESPWTLADALREAGRMDPFIVRRIAEQIAQALAHAHEEGVVHRDLKPANILLTDREPAKANALLADFGLARVVGENWLNSRISASVAASVAGSGIGTADTLAHAEGTSTQALLGTYEYMSPEQREGKPADERSDIYAFGVILYRMLTGRPLMGLAKPPSALDSSILPEWDRLVEQCLAADPGQRPARAREVVGTLRHFALGPPAQNAVPANNPQCRPQKPKRSAKSADVTGVSAGRLDSADGPPKGSVAKPPTPAPHGPRAPVTRPDSLVHDRFEVHVGWVVAVPFIWAAIGALWAAPVAIVRWFDHFSEGKPGWWGLLFLVAELLVVMAMTVALRAPVLRAYRSTGGSLAMEKVYAFFAAMFLALLIGGMAVWPHERRVADITLLVGSIVLPWLLVSSSLDIPKDRMNPVVAVLIPGSLLGAAVCAFLLWNRINLAALPGRAIIGFVIGLVAIYLAAFVASRRSN